ncbi:hypothetical protein C5167_049126 [Papaver somniferum]|uniref:Condensin complex subunit 1 C-terminal domain-containing protein n=1 Tax=Papaver somniferum TaxID=3469 RepID=A0A4Y7KLA7_PAPSO|nr:hypothetical protein C5167_049126 [Papaver somniferum]
MIQQMCLLVFKKENDSEDVFTKWGATSGDPSRVVGVGSSTQLGCIFRLLYLLGFVREVEALLLKVDQSPSKSMQKAISPLVRALAADDLLRHIDADVKVAVASCITEITRITAPEAPYSDDQMKDIFELIVAVFERLCDMSDRSYSKRVSILHTVVKVQSCVVMLDLECDSLILEMFKHFLNTIRDFHPEGVFTSMKKIMSLVLEESEDISHEILSLLLSILKKDNQLRRGKKKEKKKPEKQEEGEESN